MLENLPVKNTYVVKYGLFELLKQQVQAEGFLCTT